MKKKILTSLLTTLMVSTLLAPVVFADTEKNLQLIPPCVVSNPPLAKIDKTKFKSISTADLVVGRVYRITDNDDNFIGYYRYVSIRKVRQPYYTDVYGNKIDMGNYYDDVSFVKVDKYGNDLTGEVEVFKDVRGAIEFHDGFLDEYRIYCEK